MTANRKRASERETWGRLLGGAVVFVAALAGARAGAAQTYTHALTLKNPAPAQSGFDDDEFGLAIAAVGSKVLVGAPGEDLGGPDYGAVYLLDAGTGALQLTIPNPAASSINGFGREVAALGGDLVVAAPNNVGGVYIFDGTTGGLVRTIANPDPCGPSGGTISRFGTAVAAMGSTLVVAAPPTTCGPGGLFFFDGGTGVLLRTIAFGAATVAVDGTRVLAAYGNANVRLYDGSTGALLQVFGVAALEFHYTIALAGDRVFIGVTDSSGEAIYVFDANSGAFVRRIDVPSVVPAAMTAIAAIGGRVLTGHARETTKGDDAGGAYLVDSTSGALVDSFFTQSTDPPSHDLFGTTLAPAPMGFLVGAPGAGTGGAVGTGVVYVYDACGNGTRAIGEQCDDGNLLANDGCSPRCQLELCPAAPSPGCKKAQAGKSRLVIVDKQRDSSDAITWRWSRGAATTPAELGNPLTTTAYALCLYVGPTPTAPILDLAVLPGGTCGVLPCWQSTPSSSLKYKSTARTPSGIAKLQLKPGATTAAGIALKGGSGRLGFPPPGVMPLPTPVTVQLRNSDTGACWEAMYSGTVLQNVFGKFVALSDP